MKGTGDGLEFEAFIGGDGRIKVPEGVLAHLATGSRLRVRLVPEVIAEALERKNVTAEEVDRIAAVQIESREQVISFLLAEGVLASAPRRRRTKDGTK